MLNFDERKFHGVIGGAVGLREKIEACVDVLAKQGCRNVFLLGSGGTYAHMLAIQYVLSTRSSIPSWCEIAAEFVLTGHRDLGPGSICLFASRTGTTPETLAAARYCKKAGATTIGLVAKLGTPLADECDFVFDNFAEDDILGESLHIQFLVFTLRLMHDKGEFPRYAEVVAQFPRLAENLVAVKRQFDGVAEDWALKHAKDGYHILVGSGNLWGEAYNYAMCILEEMQWLKTKSVHSAEFFHGTLELLEKETSVILFKSECETRSLDERVERFCPQITSGMQVIDSARLALPGLAGDLRVYFSPLLIVTALERVSSHLEKETGHSLQIRRYYHRMDY